MNIRRCLIFILPVVLIVGSIVAVFFVKVGENENIEGVQTADTERLVMGDEPIPIPVNKSLEEFQERLYREGEANLEEVIKGMSTFEAAKYLRSGMTPSHNNIFFEKINQAIEENPTFEALMFRGEAFWSLRDNKESARKDFAKAVEINPESYKAHQELARVLCALGDPDNSIVEAKKAIELGSKEGYFIMGEDYFIKGDLKESLKYYQEFDKYVPNTPAVGTIEFLKSKIAKLKK